MPRPRRTRRSPIQRPSGPQRRSRPRAQSAPASRPALLTLALEWFLNPDHLPLVVAKAQGDFRDAGIDLSILIPTVPEESLELVAAGKADFGVGEQTNLISANDRGSRLVSLGPLLSKTAVCLMYLKDGPVKQLQDLRGRRVAWPGLDIDLPILGTMLEAVGLTHDDILPVDVGFALTDALISGKADAVFGAFVNYERVEAELKGVGVEFVSPTAYHVPELYQLVLFTSQRMVTNHPSLVRGFVRGLTRGLAVTHDFPEQALEAYLKANATADPTLSARTFQATLPFFPRTARQEDGRWKSVRDWLFARGVIGKKMPLASLFTNKFVPPAS